MIIWSWKIEPKNVLTLKWWCLSINVTYMARYVTNSLCYEYYKYYEYYEYYEYPENCYYKCCKVTEITGYSQISIAGGEDRG